MTLSEYIPKARSFAVFPPDMRTEYISALLTEEKGEFIKPISKGIRKGEIKSVEDLSLEQKHYMVLELGDIVWCLVNKWSDKHINCNQFVSSIIETTERFCKLEIERLREFFDISLRQILVDLEKTNVAEATHINLQLITKIAFALGYTLSEVLEANIAKLEGRKQRGTIVGEGDNR